MARKKAGGQDRAFLDAIAETPEDDAPRLVYADWLEDNGQPHRAELIRLQCQLARMEEWDPDRLDLELREAELLCVHGKDWEAQVPYWARSGHRHGFRRGFLDHLSITVTEFLKRGPALFAAAPVSDVQIRNVRSKVAQVAASPLLGRLAALDLDETHLSPGERSLLGASPHLGNLRELSMVYARLDVENARALAGWPSLPRLERLDVGTKSGEAQQELIRPGRLASLRRLALRGQGSAAALHALAEAAPALTHLTLYCEGVRVGGMAALDAHPTLTSLRLKGRHHHADPLTDLGLTERLTELEVDLAALSPEGLAKLAGPSLAKLRWLSLQGASGSSKSLWHLAAAPLGALARLDLHGVGLGAQLVRVIGASPHLAGVRRLHLKSNSLGDDGTEALAASPLLAKLAYLDLGYCEIGPRGAAALAASPHVAGLRFLRLTQNPLGDDGLRALANSPHLGELRVLEVVGVKAGEAGVRALARSPGLGKLRQVQLYFNELESDSPVFDEFADVSHLPSLLSLAREAYEQEPVTVLGRALTL